MGTVHLSNEIEIPSIHGHGMSSCLLGSAELWLSKWKSMVSALCFLSFSLARNDLPQRIANSMHFCCFVLHLLRTTLGLTVTSQLTNLRVPFRFYYWLRSAWPAGGHPRRRGDCFHWPSSQQWPLCFGLQPLTEERMTISAKPFPCPEQWLTA